MKIKSSEKHDYENVIYTFTARRRHLFGDKIYNVHVLGNVITIGEV